MNGNAEKNAKRTYRYEGAFFINRWLQMGAIYVNAADDAEAREAICSLINEVLIPPFEAGLKEVSYSPLFDGRAVVVLDTQWATPKSLRWRTEHD